MSGLNIKLADCQISDFHAPECWGFFCDDILKNPSASGGVAPRPLPGALPLDPTGGLLRPPDPPPPSPHHFPPFSLFPSPMSDVHTRSKCRRSRGAKNTPMFCRSLQLCVCQCLCLYLSLCVCVCVCVCVCTINKCRSGKPRSTPVGRSVHSCVCVCVCVCVYVVGSCQCLCVVTGLFLFSRWRG